MQSEASSSRPHPPSSTCCFTFKALFPLLGVVITRQPRQSGSGRDGGQVSSWVSSQQSQSRCTEPRSSTPCWDTPTALPRQRSA